MQVTSVILGDDGTTITATGDMGAYGKVYVTYNLKMTDITSGTVTGQEGEYSMTTSPLALFRAITSVRVRSSRCTISYRSMMGPKTST